MRDWIADTCFAVADSLGSILGYALIVGVFFIPLAILRRTRPFGGGLLMVSSYLLGAFVWFYSAGVTFTLWGWTGLIIGIIIMGFGVVPMAILASFLNGYSSMAFTTIALVLATFAVRLAGGAILERA